jgi:hypothetical protein
MFCILVGILCSAFHPFHLSVTEMKYNTQSHTIEISTKLFINDLEAILKKKYGVSLDLTTHHEDQKSKDFLQQYLQKNMTIQIGAKNIPFTLLGAEREDDALWIYLETPITPMPRTLDLTNTLLFDLFNDQANIVHFELNGQRKSQKLNAPNGKFTLFF